MKKTGIVAMVLVALLAFAGMAGAVTFEKTHVEKNLTLPSASTLGVMDTTKMADIEDSSKSVLQSTTYLTGINTNQYYGGITNAAAGLHAQYGADYANGEQSGVGTQNGQLSWGYTSWPTTYNYQHDGQNFIVALEQLVDMYGEGVYVVDGVAYDAQGHVLAYEDGAQTGDVEYDYENAASNPGLPTGNEDIATTVGDLCTQ
jgi:hypothetical protein